MSSIQHSRQHLALEANSLRLQMDEPASAVGGSWPADPTAKPYRSGIPIRPTPLVHTRTRVMPRWEYRELDVSLRENEAGAWHWSFISRETGQWEPFVSDTVAWMKIGTSSLDEFGTQGWELVSVGIAVVPQTDGTNAQTRHYCFKRLTG